MRVCRQVLLMQQLPIRSTLHFPTLRAPLRRNPVFDEAKVGFA